MGRGFEKVLWVILFVLVGLFLLFCAVLTAPGGVGP